MPCRRVYVHKTPFRRKVLTLAGLEPAIFGSKDQRVIHWATRLLRVPLPAPLYNVIVERQTWYHDYESRRWIGAALSDGALLGFLLLKLSSLASSCGVEQRRARKARGQSGNAMIGQS